MGGLLSVLWLAVLSLCAVLVPEQTGPAAEHPVLPDALHQRNVFVLDAPRRDVTSFDAMDGAAFGFGPTRSDLTIRAGRDPLELLQLLLLILPLEFSLQALLVLFVFGEERYKQVTPQYNGSWPVYPFMNVSP